MVHKRTAGYLNLGITADVGLPAPVGGVLAQSYRTAAAAAHKKAAKTHAPPAPLHASLLTVAG